MRWLSISTITLIGFFTATPLNSVVNAQSSFTDDFEDGDATDGLPVTWEAFSELPSIFVEDGNLVLSSDIGTCCQSAHAIAPFTYSDVDVEAVFAFPEDDGIFVSTYFRFLDGIDNTGYWAGAFPSGELAVGYAVDGTLTIARRHVFLPTGSVQAGTDVTLHVEMLGNEMEFSAWESELGAEESATIRWTDSADRFPTGDIVGVSVNPNGNLSDNVLVRSVSVTSIPEPESRCLAFFGLVVFAAVRRRP